MIVVDIPVGGTDSCYAGRFYFDEAEAVAHGCKDMGVDAGQGQGIPAEQKGRITMPKMKSNSGAAKRFKCTGSGKISRRKAFTSHILTKKSTKRKRNLRQAGIVDDTNVKGLKRLLPYL